MCQQFPQSKLYKYFTYNFKTINKTIHCTHGNGKIISQMLFLYVFKNSTNKCQH